MITAVCPGSFDPVTLGHLDIIRRAASMFDTVIVAVMRNYSKDSYFTVEERVNFLARAIDLPNVEVDFFDGLIADYARMKNAKALVKGLRAVTDFEYEFQMALTNKRLNPELETVFLTTTSENMFLSSSIVRQIAYYGGDISEFVPSCIIEDIKKRFSNKKEEQL